ncbi:hypothetical protein N7453_002559 [Penicillium expansum]|nr:hypothetical protein N7453_002559 [Penicillium expansum]
MTPAYVDQTLVGSGKIDKAAVFSATGGPVWATSAGFKARLAESTFLGIEGDQVQALVKAYVDPRSLSEGFYIGEHKYLAIKADHRSIYGRSGKQGVIIAKTNEAIVIAHYPETVQPDEATNVTESLVDHLINIGY